MKQEINPKDTSRAIAFELWMKSPMPMLTFTKTFDVTRLRKVSRRRGMKHLLRSVLCLDAPSDTRTAAMVMAVGRSNCRD